MKNARPLVIAAVALIALPFALGAVGLSINTATQMVCLAIAALGLNMLVGYTGLTSFGHSAWFGIGAYAAGISQKQWFAGQFVLPLVFSVCFVAVLSAIVGALILRRRGVYFALLTLALCALTYTVAFRWTALTGGELHPLTVGDIVHIPAGIPHSFLVPAGKHITYVLLKFPARMQ